MLTRTTRHLAAWSSGWPCSSAARYLAVVQGRSPGAVPGPVPLGKPDSGVRARAAAQLDATGVLTPDQRLLQVLLDDDQVAFEAALEERLLARRENVGTDPAPRSLLPVGP